MNYYPFHIGDFTAHTSHLTWEEDIAYRRMLDVYYLREKPLPHDVASVARLIRMRDSLQAVEAVLTEFFVLQEDGWHQDRCDQEIVSMRDKQEQSEARDEHEKNRMRRHRERRAEMFALLRECGVIPAWDVSMKDLQRLCNEHGVGHETDLKREQVETSNAPATAIPTPTPTPTPINTTAKAVVGAKRRKPQLGLPDDFEPNEVGLAKASEKRIDVQEELAKFRNYHEAKGSVMADWQAAWRTWVGNARPGTAGVAVVAGPKRGSDEYAAAHKSASWWRDAGFPSVYDAIANRCWHTNANEFRDGKRIEVAA